MEAIPRIVFKGFRCCKHKNQKNRWFGGATDLTITYKGCKTLDGSEISLAIQGNIGEKLVHDLKRR